MATVTSSPDCWKRWAMFFIVILMFVHSKAIQLFELHGHKLHVELLSNDSLNAVDEKWIEQPIDHFDNSNTKTWKMRYFERLDLWKENGPVYVFINGEATAKPDLITSGMIIVDLATETNGAMYLTEHRYYGESQPFDEMTTENLAYLSSKQALADVANFIKQIKSDSRFTASKVVVIGGSYAGNLAAWFKLLYPDLADAAISSSAPVLAKKDFYEYLENVGDDIKNYGSDECYNKISDTFHRYEQLLQTSEGQDQLKKELNICDTTDLSKDLNQQIVFLNSANKYMYMAQYKTPQDIKDTCESTQTVQVISNEENEFWNEVFQCYDYSFENVVTSLKGKDQMPWQYQTCTEFGYFMTTTSGRHPFTDNIHVNLYTSKCTALFGSDFNENKVDEGVKNTNDMYGGLQPNVNHVVFVNGDMDPYHRLGIMKDLSPDAPAKLISGSSHCKDMYSISGSDSQELIDAKNYVKNLIKTWIGASEEKTIESFNYEY